MDRLGGNFDGLNRVLGPPSVEASGQCRGRESQIVQLLRHTDAGGVAGSTAVGDVLLVGQTIFDRISSPVTDLIRQHSHRTRNRGPVMAVAGTGPHIHHYRRALT